jgi:hypothetical protein
VAGESDVRILLYLSAMVLLVVGIGLVIDPWRPVNAVSLPERGSPVPDLDVQADSAADPGSDAEGLRIELVGSERLEMGDRDLPMAWVAFDTAAVSDCGPLAPTPVAAMDHDLAGG